MKTVLALAVLALVFCHAMAGTYTHSQALSILNGAGIPVRSSGNCSNKNNPSCTSLDGIHSQCIDGSAGIIVLKRSSGCPITITGGTETGHAGGCTGKTHCGGWKLDVAMNSCLTNYIKSNFRSIGGNRWQSGAGNVYFDESNHWDITFAG